MSAEVFRQVGELLTEQVDAVDDLIRQRDSARSWATEYIRRVDIAEAFVNDIPCFCGTAPYPNECPKHYLLRVLQGDE